MTDVLFIVLLALVIFGPKKLPEIASQIGKYLAQFRHLKGELIDQLSSEIRSLEEHPNVPQRPNAEDRVTLPATTTETMLPDVTRAD